MKLFDKIAITHYILGAETMTTETKYFLFNWNFWTSRKAHTTEKTEEPQYYALKQGADGHLEVDEQCEYLGII